MSKEITMYLFVNTDLKMSKGKIASQTAHAAQFITANIIRSAFQTNPIPESYYVFAKWEKIGSKKIILKATTEQLKELMKLPNSVYVIDAGRTQIPENSLTVVGFYPSDQLYDKFKDYSLL